jgi:hypothetical protein
VLILSYVIIGGAIVGLIVGHIKYRQGLDWGLKAIIVSLAVGVPAGGYALIQQLYSARFTGEDIAQRSRKYTQVGTEKLGRHLAEKFPGSKALVIGPLPYPYGPLCASTPAQIQTILDGLRAGFGDRIEIVTVVTPVLPPDVLEAGWDEDGKMTSSTLLGVEEWLDAYFFNQMIEREGAGCDLIVSLASAFPEDYKQLSLYNQDPRPKLALWFPANYERGYAVRDAIVEGDIDAIVVGRLIRSSGGSVPSDLDEAFDRMYFLLTGENVKQITDANQPRR